MRVEIKTTIKRPFLDGVEVPNSDIVKVFRDNADLTIDDFAETLSDLFKKQAAKDEHKTPALFRQIRDLEAERDALAAKCATHEKHIAFQDEQLEAVPGGKTAAEQMAKAAKAENLRQELADKQKQLDELGV